MRKLLLFCLACLLTSCSDAPPAPGPGPQADSSPARPIAGAVEQEAVAEVVFPLGFWPEIDDLRPLGARSVHAAGLLNQIFEGLVGFDDSLRVVPRLARSWEVAEDLQSYTFQLRDDAVFHDGEPVRAEHVRASFESFARQADDSFWIVAPIVGAEELRSGQADHLAGLELLPEGGLRLRLQAPDGIFLRHLAMPNLAVSKPHRADPSIEVGCGPYQLKNIDQTAGRIVLSPHASYHGKMPSLNLVYQRETQPLLAYQRDALHIAPFSGPSPLFDSTHVHSWPSLSTTYLAFDLRYQETRSRELRRLVNAVYLRSRFVANSARSATTAFGPVPPGLSGYRDQAAPELGERPRRLDEVVTLSASFSDLELERFLTRELEPYGVQLMPGQPAQLRQASWIADFPDADNFLRVLFHSQSGLNLAHYAEPELDSLLVSARRMSAEPARSEIYRRVVEQLVHDLPWVFLWHTENRLLVSPRLRGLRTCALDFQGALMLPQTRLELLP